MFYYNRDNSPESLAIKCFEWQTRCVFSLTLFYVDWTFVGMGGWFGTFFFTKLYADKKQNKHGDINQSSETSKFYLTIVTFDTGYGP